MIGVVAGLGVVRQVETEVVRILAPLKGYSWWLLLAVVGLSLIIAARESRKRHLVALAEKPSSDGDVLRNVVSVAQDRVSSDSVKSTSFGRWEVVHMLQDTYGRSRPARRRVSVDHENRPARDIEVWRRCGRWVIGDLDDSTIEKLADDLLDVAKAKHWIKELNDGSTLGEDLSFDDYYSTRRR